LLLTKGWPTRCGSKTIDTHASCLEDSPAAARLREGGAVLFGKTTTSEFGLKGMGDSPLTGITRNPWNLEHTPGGSSAGAVAAVAAGLGCLAVGTDGGGSIRVPAAYTGVVGLKPSYGRVPSHPASVIGAPPHVGPIARSVRDAQLLLDTLSQADDRDPFRAPTADSAPPLLAVPLRSLKIGYLAGAHELSVREIREAFDSILARVRAIGLDPVAVDLGLDGARAVLTTLFNARAAHTLLGLSTAARSQVDASIELSAREGEKLSALDYLAAEAERTALALRVAHVFRSHDLLLTPTTAEPAPTVDADFSPKRAPFTGIFSLTRQPAVSIPCVVTGAGLPVGLQIVGRHFEDALVLRLAEVLEAGAAFTAPPEP
jgi:aspartyl-tRNA(Asn)/glutamyl-tRNA(Gln) amidotransferase subunit A